MSDDEEIIADASDASEYSEEDGVGDGENKSRRLHEEAHEEEEDDGEDLMDESKIEQDYIAIPALDTYDPGQLDDEEQDELDYRERRIAEKEMRKRDHEAAKAAGRGVAMLEEDEEEAPRRQRRRIATTREEGVPVEVIQEEEESYVNLDEFKGPLIDWLLMEAPRREIRRRFRQFLSNFMDEHGKYIYAERIMDMCSENKESLNVSYLHLSRAVPILAIWVADAPTIMLEIFNEEAYDMALNIFPKYVNVYGGIHVRITELPIIDSLRDLRQMHLNALIKVSGVVTRRSTVFPQLSQVKFNCSKCNFLMGPYIQNTVVEVQPGRCPQCQAQGPFFVNTSETIYKNYQKITLQESPGTVPAGRVPRQKEIILLNDLIDLVRPGEEVEITGIYQHSFEASLNTKNGFPVFSTKILANFINKSQEMLEAFRLTEEDTAKIMKLSKQPNIAQLVFNSIGPSIYGHDQVKKSLAMAMFGGEAKPFESGHRIRGDINVLIMGDPGTAKSQFLKYVEKTAHRAVYTTGKGASAVGLTASVRIDPLTREWTLEGGALVLADKGVCLIDEFDKMSDQDRTSIHEAMEQQSISISKAGIITTLQARCAVIAGANPIKGRYDSSLSFAENVELTDAILSRFDILCVVRDTVDAEHDARLAGFVIDSHTRSHPHYVVDTEEAERLQREKELASEQMGGAGIDQQLLRKYIMYSKQKCHPKLHQIDDDKIAKLYADLRRESMVTGGIPIAVRHIESMIRMSEAHARIHLREYVTEDDIDFAIAMMLNSFISTQKFSVMRSLTKHFSKYLSHKKDNFELLLFALNQLVKEHHSYRLLSNPDVDPSEPIEIQTEDFHSRASELNIDDLTPFYKSSLFHTNSFRLDNAKKIITKTFEA